MKEGYREETNTGAIKKRQHPVTGLMIIGTHGKKGIGGKEKKNQKTHSNMH